MKDFDGWTLLLAIVLGVAALLWGFGMGRESVRSDCDDYGKVKINSHMYTCSKQ